MIPKHYVTNNYDKCQYRYICNDLQRLYNKNLIPHAYFLGNGVLEVVTDVTEAIVPVGV